MSIEFARPLWVMSVVFGHFAECVCLPPNSGGIADIPQPRLRAISRHSITSLDGELLGQARFPKALDQKLRV
jgi:hypothetical protein